MGPFEMLESIGVEKFFSKIGNIKNNHFLKDLKKEKLKKNFTRKDKNIQILKL